MDVNLKWDEEAQFYVDMDHPDVTWQLSVFADDSYDCIVCDFPIDPGLHFVCLDDGSENAHRTCVLLKSE